VATGKKRKQATLTPDVNLGDCLREKLDANFRDSNLGGEENCRLQTGKEGSRWRNGVRPKYAGLGREADGNV